MKKPTVVTSPYPECYQHGTDGCKPGTKHKPPLLTRIEQWLHGISHQRFHEGCPECWERSRI